MTIPAPFASLASIDAIVIDTETTGLDARTARIVQIGVIAITAGKLGRIAIVDQLVDPEIEVPVESSRIHGIATENLRGMPTFKAISSTISGLLADHLLIGHTISYDVSVLQEEYRMADIPWKSCRALDIRTLARLVAPGLADHSLDRLCEWLGVSNSRRHSAVGDAVATGEVFLKLVPLLRQKGIRTLAEAEKACVGLAEADARAAGGLMVFDATQPTTSAALARLDVFAYRHRVRDVMTSPAVVMAASATLSDAVDCMLKRSLSSIFVDLGSGVTGIVTERDALRALHGQGEPAKQQLVAEVAKHPLHSIAEDDHVYRAIGRMERLGFRHLGVHDRSGRVVGALTPRNLLRNRATSAITIGDGIAAAQTPEQLAATWNEVQGMALNLLREAVDARTIAGVISAEVRSMTRRATELAEDAMERAGKGRAPNRYAVLVLGSAGRGESLLAADQDNAIIYEAGGSEKAEDAWFQEMATIMAASLDKAGIDFCKGGVMAKNSEWRGSREDWSRRVASWITRQKPQDLLNVDIYFDADVVSGNVDLGNAVLDQSRVMARRSPAFIMMLTEMARQWRSPIGIFGRFQKVDGRVDLKIRGLLPIFTAARVLALRHEVGGNSTEDRLRGLIRVGGGAPETIQRILDAHEILLKTVLRQQLEDGDKGVALSARVDIDRMDKAERQALKAAIEVVPEVIDLVSEGRI